AMAGAVAETVRANGRLDGVVLAVGKWVVGPPALHESTEEVWHEGIERNLDGAFAVLQPVLDQMARQRRGAVVLVSASPRVRGGGTASWAAGRPARADRGGYRAGGLRPQGAGVNGGSPGNMAKVAPGAPPDRSAPPPLADDVATSPWEVARAIRFLLSDEA